MDIKEIALRIGEEADEYADALLQSKGEYHPNWHTVRDEYFAEALVTEIAKQNAPVSFTNSGELDYLDFKRKDSGLVAAAMWKDYHKDSNIALYTVPPTAEQIANETAEAIAAYITSGRYMVLNPGVLISAEQHTQYLKNHDIYQANAIRRGAWKEFKK